MSKKIIDAYVKYTAKKPILFFAMIVIGVLSIFILSLSTKTSVVVSNDGIVNSYSVTINGEIDSYTGFIYVYNDRNDRVYSIEISETIHKNGQTIFFTEDENEYISTINQQKIKVDVPIREVTIFERVFLKGGRMNG